MQIRLARPTDKLDEVTRFYRDALGFPVLWHFQAHNGYSGIMLQVPGTELHLEFTHAEAGSPCPAPTEDNLLVLYHLEKAEHQAALRRVEENGHTPVEPANPYWNTRGKTYRDPDGWRVVLCDGPPFTFAP